MDDKKNQLWADYQANLAQAQREAALARRQADEAAFLRQRQMNQALSGRGLANSGLQQLGTAQNQISMSQQLNEQAVQQAGVRSGLYQQYQQNLSAEETRQADLYNQITQQGLATGLTGTELADYVSNLSSAYGVTLSEAQKASITSTADVAVAPTKISGSFGSWEPSIERVTNRDTGEGSFTFDDGSGAKKIEVSSYEDAANKYKEALKRRYAGNEGVLKFLDKVEVIASSDAGLGIHLGFGKGYNFKFSYNGKTYERLQQLVDAYNKGE